MTLLKLSLEGWGGLENWAMLLAVPGDWLFLLPVTALDSFCLQHARTHRQEAPAAADMRLNLSKKKKKKKKKKKEITEANVSECKDRYHISSNSLTRWRDFTTSVRLSISDFTLRSDIWVPETSTCPWGASPSHGLILLMRDATVDFT